MNSKVVAFIALIAILLGCVASAEVETIKLHLNEGSSQWWIAVDPRSDLFETVKVELREAGDSRWTQTQYNPGWPYFAVASTSGRGFALPLSLRLTADNGEQVIATLYRISGGAIVDTAVQYSGSVTDTPTVPATESPTVPATQAPTTAPTARPSTAPTTRPSTAPTTRPSTAPTTRPSTAPTTRPSTAPTTRPTSAPTVPATQAPTQAATQAPTRPATQAPTQPATEAPTQAPTRPATQAPTKPATQAPTQPATQAPTKPATQAPTQPATQAPTRPATQAPTQAPTRPATQAPTQAPTRPATQAPTQAPTKPATQAPTIPSADACSIVSTRMEPIKVLVPLYVYPGKAWDDLIAAAKSGVKIVAIVNPNSGPAANGPDSAYVSYMKKFQDAGIEMVGYVHTLWGARSLDTVNTEIGIYASKYAGVTGIFFDEASTESKDVSYYRQAYNTVLSKNFVHSILNPGTQPDKQYLDISTNILIFENYATELARVKFDSWVKCAPSSSQKSGYQYKFSAMIHTAALSDMPALINTAHNMGMGFIYVTDGLGGCCTYNNLVTYFTAQANTIVGLNK